MHLLPNIPFTIFINGQRLAGYLSPWASPLLVDEIPVQFQVYLWEKGGYYYQRDLLFRDGKWYGCNNYKDPEALSQELGKFVEAWYG